VHTSVRVVASGHGTHTCTSSARPASFGLQKLFRKIRVSFNAQQIVRRASADQGRSVLKFAALSHGNESRPLPRNTDRPYTPSPVLT
jgi:hypothetical protein